eukprot:CAMPEP_0114983638 /NCGR_PEP_ID=MMETSP0216-20121206/6814_1 /TAXON_ID=223996 /ORGANISM="Protocruzia adherens, Strain Boccale" /LENGTH=47 /DNA_ID= /DNA_START= /DNA_END= /DNA_ORIENTATION=
MAAPSQEITYTHDQKHLAFKEQMLTDAQNVFLNATWKIKKQKKGFTS